MLMLIRLYRTTKASAPAAAIRTSTTKSRLPIVLANSSARLKVSMEPRMVSWLSNRSWNAEASKLSGFLEDEHRPVAFRRPEGDLVEGLVVT
jgi:hypothetical protein